jgi:cellulose synthase/poly-beta-1,6-N-acetylglucosamine synthase-like glycosyltransferase
VSDQAAAWIEALAGPVDTAVLVYFGLLNLCYLTLLVAAVVEMRRTRNEAVGISDHIVVGSRLAPTISILAPAYNEEATIAASVQSLLTLDYPNLEVVVITDGCKDDTIGVLEREFALVEVYRAYAPRVPTKGVVALYRSLRHANLVVVNKLNGGKADALNVGLNLASGELVCAIDADTLIERGALVRLMRPMLIDPDVVATGGTIRPVNAVTTRHGSVVDVNVPRTWLAGIQVVEYLRAFLLGRLGLNRLGGNLIISGAFGLFRREPMIAAGGWLHDTVGEDMELVVRLRRLGYERGTAHDVVFVPDPTAWTEVPESVGVLGRQRDRWHRGLTDTLWRHRHLIGNPRYGAMGLVVFPYFVVVELLAPIVEALGLVMLVASVAVGLVDRTFAILFFALAVGIGLVLSVATLLLDQASFLRYKKPGDLAWLLWWAVVENVGYRQLTVYWRLRGLVKYMRGRSDWGAMTRKGFATQPAAAAAPTAARPG